MSESLDGDLTEIDDDLYPLEYLWRFGVGLTVILLIGLVLAQLLGTAAAIGIGVLIVLAGGTVGALLGFLFAIPRVLSKEDDAQKAAAQPTGDAPKARLLGSNTNLERVSDWLTTMLVGVGLTQLANVDDALVRFRLFLSVNARVFPGGSAGTLPAIGPLLLIVGLAIGFAAMYLLTRLQLSQLFQRVEEFLSRNRLSRQAIADVKKTASTIARKPGASENMALRTVLARSRPSVDDSLNLMYSLLYRPDGYQTVIELGGQLNVTSAPNRAEYWFYLAAAFGQKHHALSIAEELNPDAIQSAKDNALDCARRAVELDAGYKARLWQISEPNSMDDDLADFRAFPEFLAITGRQ